MKKFLSICVICITCLVLLSVSTLAYDEGVTYVPFFPTGLGESDAVQLGFVSGYSVLFSGFFTTADAPVTSIRYDTAQWDYSSQTLTYAIVVSPTDVAGDWTIYVPYSTDVPFSVSVSQVSQSYAFDTAVVPMPESEMMLYSPSAFTVAASGVSYTSSAQVPCVRVSAYFSEGVQNFLSVVTIRLHFGDVMGELVDLDLSSPIGVFDYVTTTPAWYYMQGFFQSFFSVTAIGQLFAVVVVLFVMGIVFNWLRSL